MTRALPLHHGNRRTGGIFQISSANSALARPTSTLDHVFVMRGWKFWDSVHYPLLERRNQFHQNVLVQPVSN